MRANVRKKTKNARKCARKIPGRTKNERRWGAFRHIRSGGGLPEDTMRNIQYYAGTEYENKHISNWRQHGVPLGT